MSFAERARDWYGIDVADPAGWVLTLVVMVVLVWPIGAPLWLALLAGVAMVSTKTAIEVVQTRRSRLPEAWVQAKRARVARRNARRSAKRVSREGGIASASEVLSEIDVVVDEVHHAARRVTSVHEALERINQPALERTRRNLVTGRGSAPSGLIVEQERAVAAIDEQLLVHSRLATAEKRLLAKMQAAVLGIERIDAQLVELATLHEALGGAGVAVDLLANTSEDLDALREALTEAEFLFESTDVL